MRELCIVVHNVRSCYNVGSILRTAEGLGVQKVILSGYTPYPLMKNDKRLPHLAQKISYRIDKTALGAARNLNWRYQKNIFTVLNKLSNASYIIAALEQSPSAQPLVGFSVPKKFALVVGREVEGIEDRVLNKISLHLQIPMLGKKESYNVSAAAAMALYHCRFSPDI
jgi:23S rRNA (guanosine2251-2'-O)-methyltransferase